MINEILQNSTQEREGDGGRGRERKREGARERERGGLNKSIGLISARLITRKKRATGKKKTPEAT